MTVVEVFFVILLNYMATHTSINSLFWPASMQGGGKQLLYKQQLSVMQ